MKFIKTVIKEKESFAKDLKEVVEKIVLESQKQKKPLWGLGHRIHTDDPRTKKIFSLAKEAGLKGETIQILQEAQKALEKNIGKKLPINIDGAMAAVLVELGFSEELANGFFILSRLPGLMAHFQEERGEKPMRQIDFAAGEYQGEGEKRV